MIIVVNTRLLIHDRLDGIGRFTYETLSRITPAHPEAHFVFLFDRAIHEDFIFSENITPAKIFPPARRPWLFNAWLNLSVHGVLRDLNPDLFLSPDGFLPTRGKTKCLPVIHDLNFLHHPEDLPLNIMKWYIRKFPRFAQRATRIATVSEFSKNDIVQQYGIDKGKIDVVFDGASAGFHPLTQEEISIVRKQYSGGAPYFVYVGALHKRKNLDRLVLAYEMFRKKNDTNVKLLITGGNYWKYEELQQAVESISFKEDVVFTGRLNDEELHRVMGGALALTYVPYFEGFGIPIVEAMACDVPVITANVTSMPEVGGDAALYADPFSVESIASAMTLLLKDEPLRNELVKKSRVQREKFSWDKTAELLWESMLKTMQGER